MNRNIVFGGIAVVAVVAVVYLAMQSPVPPTNIVPSPVTTNTGTTPPPPPVAVSETPRTPGKPVPTTNATVAPTDTTAVVTGTVNPSGAITTYWYEYGTTKDLGKKTSVQIAGSGYTAITAPGYITGLTKNTVYYFKLVAANQFGTIAGDENTLTTSAFSSTPVGGLATATTLAAVGMTSTAAILKGSVSPNKVPTQYWFEIGKNGTLGGVTAFVAVGDGSAKVPAEATVENLDAGTTYYYRINAQNQYGTVNGAILTFKTTGKLVQPVPVVTTQVPSSIATTTVTLNGTVNPYSLQTSYWFEYSTNSGFSGNATKTTSKTSAGAVSTTVTVQATVAGLKTKTTYYVRIVAENPGGTVRGDVQTFQTK